MREVYHEAVVYGITHDIHKVLMSNDNEKEPLTGEYALLYAILERAILDAAGPEVKRGKKKKKQRDAKRFLFAWDYREDGTFNDEPFSFPWVCLMLNKEPHILKAKIRKLIKEDYGILHTRTRCALITRIIENAASSATEAEIYFL